MSLPAPLRLLITLLGVAVCASVAVGLFLALRQSPPAWFFLAFEPVIALAAIFLIALGRGKIKEGPAITLLCCAGAIGVGALLGFVGTGRQINNQSILWLVAPRIGVAGLLVLLTVLELVFRAPSLVLPRLAKGLAATVPLLLLAFFIRNGSLQAMMGSVNASSPPLAFGAWMILGLLVVVFVSAAGHFYITGFAQAVKAWDVQHPPVPSPSPAAATATQTPPSSTPPGTPA